LTRCLGTEAASRADWRGIFLSYMKLNQNVAVDMMQHPHRYLLYLDTKILPIPRQTLDEISDHF
jgi:hypothetical protein